MVQLIPAETSSFFWTKQSKLVSAMGSETLTKSTGSRRHDFHQFFQMRADVLSLTLVVAAAKGAHAHSDECGGAHATSEGGGAHDSYASAGHDEYGTPY